MINNFLTFLWKTTSLNKVARIAAQLKREGKNKECKKFLSDISSILKDCEKKKEKRVVTDSRIAECISKYSKQIDSREFTKTSTPWIGALFVPAKKIKNQLSLFPSTQRRPIEESLTVHGLDGIELDLYQQRVLDGLMHRFSHVDYSEEYIDLKESELYALAGVKRIKTSREKLEYPGYETEKVKKALVKLNTNLHQIFITKLDGYDPKRKRNTYAAAVSYERLIKMAWFYKNIASNKLEEFKEEIIRERHHFTKGKLSTFFSHYRIALNPVIKTDIEKSFRLLPHDIYNEIKRHKQSTGNGKRVRVAASETNYIRWLHRHAVDKTEVHIHYLKLAEALKFSALLKGKRYKELRARMIRHHQLAADLGYLLSYETSTELLFSKKKMDILYLNPERFYHLSRKKRSTTKRA